MEGRGGEVTNEGGKRGGGDGRVRGRDGEVNGGKEGGEGASIFTCESDPWRV